MNAADSGFGCLLTAARLRELVSYDPLTGIFTNRVTNGRRIAGQAAGSTDALGYVKMKVDRKQYKAHRLAWLYVYDKWPEQHIDHIDGNPSNNRIANLRDVSVSVNLQNRKRAPAHNKSGLLGVWVHRERFISFIKTMGVRQYLGTFDTPEEAHAAYLSAKRANHEGNTL